MRDNRDRRKRSGPRLNNEITVAECRLMVEGESVEYGVVSIDEAREIAREKGLDLVEVSPTAKPPVVKVIDYGRFKYNQQKRTSEAKKKQIRILLKEIQFRPNIEIHDLETKLKRAKKFLEQGDKIKLVMQFRGREMAYKDAGLQKFKGITNSIKELGGLIESEAKMMGNRIITIVAPEKKLLDAARRRIKEAAKAQAQLKKQAMQEVAKE